MGREPTRRREYFHFFLAGLIFLLLSGCATPEKIKTGMNSEEEARQHLLLGQGCLAQRDFEGALRENYEILSLALHQAPEDEALFNIGMIYAHPDNSKRDYLKSLYFWNRLIEDHPKSLWAWQAKAWKGMIQQNERLSQSIKTLNLQVKQSDQERKRLEEERESHRPLLHARELLAQGKYEEGLKELQKILSASPRHPMEDEALFETGLIYAQPANPKKDYGRSLNYFKKLMKDYPQSLWSELAKAWTGMLQENDKLNQSVEKLNQMIEKSKQVDIEIEEKKREKGK